MLPRQCFLQTGPALLRLAQDVARIGGKGVAAFRSPEQEQPLSRDQPKPGLAGNSYAARHVGRVVTTELRAVDFRIGEEKSPVSLIAEPPDGSRFGNFETWPAGKRPRVGEVSHGVEAAKGQPGIAVDHHPLGRRRLGRDLHAPHCGNARKQRNKGYSRTPAVSFLPLCRHS
jgi:hypothetical protein